MWTRGSKKTHRVVSNVPSKSTLVGYEKTFVEEEMKPIFDTNPCEVLLIKWNQAKEIHTVEDAGDVVSDYVRWHSNASMLVQEEFCELCHKLVGFYNEIKHSPAYSKENKKPCFSLNECSKYLRAFREHFNRVIRMMNLKLHGTWIVSNRDTIKEILDKLKTKIFRCAKVLCTVVNFIHTDCNGNPLHCAQIGAQEVKDKSDNGMHFRMSYLETIDQEVNDMAPLVISCIEEMFIDLA